MGEEDVIAELKQLKVDADGIENDLRKTNSKINNMNSQDRKLKDLLNKMKTNEKNPPSS